MASDGISYNVSGIGEVASKVSNLGDVERSRQCRVSRSSEGCILSFSYEWQDEACLCSIVLQLAPELKSQSLLF